MAIVKIHEGYYYEENSGHFFTSREKAELYLKWANDALSVDHLTQQEKSFFDLILKKSGAPATNPELISVADCTEDRVRKIKDKLVKKFGSLGNDETKREDIIISLGRQKGYILNILYVSEYCGGTNYREISQAEWERKIREEAELGRESLEAVVTDIRKELLETAETAETAAKGFAALQESFDRDRETTSEVADIGDVIVEKIAETAIKVAATEHSNRKEFRRIARSMAVFAVILVLASTTVICLAIKKTNASNNVAVNNAPVVNSISFIPGHEWMELVIGTSQKIDIEVKPDDADDSTVNAIPLDPTIATVENLWVTATDVWDENAPHQTDISIQGGRSNTLTLPVYVRNRIYHPGTALGSNDVGGGGEYE